MLYDQLKKFGKVKTNEPLSKHTTYKIGGPADYFVIVDDTEKLVDLVKYLNGEGVRYVVLGGGSNTLAKDEGFDGIVIQTNDQRSTINDQIIEAASGAKLSVLLQESIKAGLVGLEWAIGIPGTIGGAVFGNAAAMGKAIADNVDSVEVLQDGEIVKLSKEDCNFKYKKTIFQNNNDVILRVWLKLEKGDTAKAMKKALEDLKYRNSTHPQGFCAGCTFKNYVVQDEKEKQKLIEKINDEKVTTTIEKYGKVPVGRLIELIGMRGTKIGEAQVSEKHANFVMNLGDAKAEDVLKLIEEIKTKVYNKFGIEIEEEVRII